MTKLYPPFWIGIQGGTCAGKTELSLALRNLLGLEKTLTLSLDLFYIPHDRGQDAAEHQTCYFDHPSSIDWELLLDVFHSLNEGKSANIPSYDYVTGLRGNSLPTQPKEFIIFEGLWPFSKMEITDFFNVKIFVDTPPDIRLVRRINRDILQGNRGWTLDSLLRYYTECIHPLHIQFTEPGKELADIIVSGEEDLSSSTKFLYGSLLNLLSGSNKEQ